jgi:hypothetical protein
MKYTLSLPADIIGRLKAYTEQTGTPQSQVALRAIRDDLTMLEERLPDAERRQYQARAAVLAAEAKASGSRSASPGLASTSAQPAQAGSAA